MAKRPDHARGDVGTPDQEAEGGENRAPIEMAVTQPKNLLLMLPSAGSLQSERRRGLLSEGNHFERLATAPAKRGHQGPRPAKVGSSETWHDKMNQRIGRMSRQLSFNPITSGTLTTYDSSWGHWRLFCGKRVQADGSMHEPWLPGTDRGTDER